MSGISPQIGDPLGGIRGLLDGYLTELMIRAVAVGIVDAEQAEAILGMAGFPNGEGEPSEPVEPSESVEWASSAAASTATRL
jgi:hypothetical protein